MIRRFDDVCCSDVIRQIRGRIEIEAKAKIILAIFVVGLCENALFRHVTRIGNESAKISCKLKMNNEALSGTST